MNRLILVFLASLTLVACGGGGGGGGGTSASETGSSNNNAGSGNEGGEEQVEEQEETFSQKQNQYLPLIENTGWRYSTVSQSQGVDSVTAQTLTTDLEDRFEVDYDVVSQVLASTPTKVNLFEISGTFRVEDFNLTVTKLEFDTAIALLDTSVELEVAQTILSSATATGRLDGLLGEQSLPFSVSGQVTYSEGSFQSGDLAGGAEFPAIVSTASYTLEYSLFGLSIDISDVTYFVKGVGIVSRNLTVEYQDETIEQLFMQITGLLELPEPIIYELEQSDPVQIGLSSIRITEALSPNDYSILNSDDLESAELDWVSVALSEDETAFVVSMNASDNLPDSSTSVVVYLGEEGSTDQLPVNVTLTVSD